MKIVDDDFIRFIGSSSDLMWWKKTGKNDIVFLNDSEPGGRVGLGIDAGHLLQDLVRAQQLVVEEDFFRFKLFIKSMREGKEAAAIFRLRDNQGQRLWWRIVGAPGMAKPSHYYGYIHDITENVSLINHLLEKDLVRQTMIETDDHPVLRVVRKSKETLQKDAPAPEKPVRQPPDKEAFEHILKAAMAGKDQMIEILDALLNHQSGEPLFDAVMYADVHIKKGSVEVYGRGEAFKTLTPGTSYQYEGTISQLIREEHPDYIILDNTLESTKPIDWALFIPYGIRSYFAKPFFHGSKLRTLLFFCCTAAHHFSEANRDLYEVYYAPFLKGLRNWRKSKRKQN